MNMNSKSHPNAYIKSVCQLGNKVFNYLREIFIVLPCKYMHFLLAALKVVALYALKLNSLQFVQKYSQVCNCQHFASLLKC